MTSLTKIKALAASVREKSARAALLPLVLLASSPVFAELPTMPTPGTGIGGQAVQDGDWIAAMGAYFKAGLTILGLVLAALGFIYVVGGALGKWRQYSMGRADISELKEYFILGTIMTVFLVAMVNVALKIFE